MRIARCSAVVIAALLTTSAGRAQTLRGVTVDATDRPISGVVVMLVDRSSQVAARALTNERGEFRLKASHPGAYQVRTLRIGFRPALSQFYDLQADAESTTRIVLTNVAIVLDTMRTTGKSICGGFTTAGASTYAVWEQIRTALTAAELTAASRTIEATVVTYNRTLARTSNSTSLRVLDPQFSVSVGLSTQSWRPASPDSLRKNGYVVTGKNDSTVFYAPELGVLLSEGFVEDHCFRLASDSSANRIGISFEPTSQRRRIPEVRGTLWLDRTTSELTRLEFRYVNVARVLEENADGALDFARLRDGTWVISNWYIRMPRLTRELPQSLVGALSALRVEGNLIASGTVALVRRETDTLWRHPPLVVTGTLRDTLSGAPIDGALVTLVESSTQAITDENGRFALSGVAPGAYTAAIRTLSLDSLPAIHEVPVVVTQGAEPWDLHAPTAGMVAEALCGPGRLRSANAGFIMGRVRLQSASPPAPSLSGIRVLADWVPDTVDQTHIRRLRTPVRPDGSFTLCGVPIGARLTLSATADSAETAEPTLVTIPTGTRMSRASLVVEPLGELDARGATFMGIIMMDSTHLPLEGVEVALPEAGKSARSNARGEFRITGIPPGTHQVSIRRVGYGPVDTTLTFAGHQIIERRVVLGRVVTLDPMQVYAESADPWMRRFEEHRRNGLGRFLTDKDLEKAIYLSTALMRDIPGINVVQGRGFASYVISRRSGSVCYLRVYVDGAVMNPFGGGYDINEIPVESIAGVEVYSGAGQTPAEYSGMGSQCGVMVIWTK